MALILTEIFPVCFSHWCLLNLAASKVIERVVAVGWAASLSF